ncbi:spore coat protein U domain-containing protein (plasmid) [Deinococcus taeanensis]|uniref:Csu type fimbrial protein n=1 Tax=Deinococcus taeanensis TaxID=2737050 RepID=UPI001CDCCCEF|nr:spore coat protein U domain-containing protein [Deinococcus taeanensis]UBV44474.1 spore coat protein U domain-containing protein [Deinococcus taeanensis]
MKSRLTLFLTCAVLFGSSPVSAASKSASFAVRVKVVGTCNIRAAALDFGTYKGSSTSGSTSAQVSCTKGMAYNVSLDNGTALRTMSLIGSPASKLTYQLGLSGAVADGSVSGIGKSGVQVLTVQGTILPNQNLVPGEYADSVTMTVNY